MFVATGTLEDENRPALSPLSEAKGLHHRLRFLHLRLQNDTSHGNYVFIPGNSAA